MKIIKKFLTPYEYSRPQIPLKKVTKIAIHYVGNPNTTAIANRDYFENKRNKYGSSHYIIGLQGEIIQCIPENEQSIATYSANSYSISIENCHPKSDGKFNEQTEKSLIELCVDLCKRYNLNPLTDIIRHYDVPKYSNGWRKKCPLYWVNYPSDFERFKKEVKEYLEQGDEEMIKYYNWMNELPDWAIPTIQKLYDRKAIQGNEKGELRLTEDMVRIFVANDRMGLYK